MNFIKMILFPIAIFLILNLAAAAPKQGSQPPVAMSDDDLVREVRVSELNHWFRFTWTDWQLSLTVLYYFLEYN